METGKISQIETEEERNARHDREEFERKVDGAPHDVQTKYYKDLQDARNKEMERMKKEGRAGLASISLEQRKEIFSVAETAIQTGVDPNKMEKEWDVATARNGGRPPIGGSKDD